MGMHEVRAGEVSDLLSAGVATHQSCPWQDLGCRQESTRGWTGLSPAGALWAPRFTGPAPPWGARVHRRKQEVPAKNLPLRITADPPETGTWEVQGHQPMLSSAHSTRTGTCGPQGWPLGCSPTRILPGFPSGVCPWWLGHVSLRECPQGHCAACSPSAWAHMASPCWTRHGSLSSGHVTELQDLI